MPANLDKRPSDQVGTFVINENILNVRIDTGELVGFNEYSETSVHSSGGGGYVGSTGGYVSAPRVSSTSTHHMKFWIRGSDGRETPFELVNSNIPLRVGQTLSIVSIQTKESNNAVCAIANHNAEKWWKITDYERDIREYGNFRCNNFSNNFILFIPVCATLLMILVSLGRFEAKLFVFLAIFPLSFFIANTINKMRNDNMVKEFLEDYEKYTQSLMDYCFTNCRRPL